MSAIRKMECCVCGCYAGKWRQHWNRDDEYGVCVGCVADARARGTSEDEIKNLYGTEGVNWGTGDIQTQEVSG